LRKRGRTCAQQDARCENRFVISASIAPPHYHFICKLPHIPRPISRLS
jgi:hypothetical protein